MINLPISTNQITGPLVLLALVILCHFIGPERLSYARELIISGEVWRLVSANLVHTSLNHTLLNATGIVLLWLLHGDHYDWSYLPIVFVAALGTTLGMLAFSGDLVSYAGLSGALHGLFVWGMVRDFEKGELTAWLLLIGLTIKLTWEALYGGDPGVAELIGSPVVVDAHLYGSVSGLLVALACLLWRRAL